MACILIPDLDEAVVSRLSARAALHGRSMEDEASVLLRSALQADRVGGGLAASIRARMAPLGGVDLEPMPREPIREPPTFDA